jgi:hypothetical protein
MFDLDKVYFLYFLVKHLETCFKREVAHRLLFSSILFMHGQEYLRKGLNLEPLVKKEDFNQQISFFFPNIV